MAAGEAEAAAADDDAAARFFVAEPVVLWPRVCSGDPCCERGDSSWAARPVFLPLAEPTLSAQQDTEGHLQNSVSPIFHDGFSGSDPARPRPEGNGKPWHGQEGLECPVRHLASHAQAPDSHPTSPLWQQSCQWLQNMLACDLLHQKRCSMLTTRHMNARCSLIAKPDHWRRAPRKWVRVRVRVRDSGLGQPWKRL